MSNIKRSIHLRADRILLAVLSGSAAAQQHITGTYPMAQPT